MRKFKPLNLSTSTQTFNPERLTLLCLALGIRKLELFEPPNHPGQRGLLVDFYPGIIETAFELGHVQSEFDAFFGEETIMVERKTLKSHWRSIITKGATEFFRAN